MNNRNCMLNKYFFKSLFFLFVFSFSFGAFAQKNLYAGIEIGSKGIKFSVIDVNNIKKGDYDIIEYWTENVGIARGISIDGNLAQEDINKAGTVVLENFSKIKKMYSVADENIFIVASSGVALAHNTQLLTDKIKALTNKDLDFINAETEGKMLLKGAIPPTDYQDAIVLDIGGGNTKGGYVNVLNDNKFEFFPLKLDYGTITLTEAINKTIVIPKEINSMSVYTEKSFEYAPILRQKIKDMLNSKPLSLQKKKIYLSGGAVWAFVTLYYNKNNEDHFVPLKMEDIVNYDAILKNNFITYENLAKTSKEAEKVTNTYSQKHLISGNNILISCLESIPDLKSKKIYFAKEGQIAWLVSYVVDRSKKIKNNF
ncbi:exopolyphosphatase [Flavobacterium aquidurense]|uniref:Putative exopolyphosphatase n=1 Tax=Flavobacterium aquidurense TaxID=362413 RepID=A0A0Q0W7W3_9FLAO|nr:exopolyphosphatase [Flavobacterium aquidurense]KQB42565.1 putative exopolyphosphatase [Flavobacterium aquidurense]